MNAMKNITKNMPELRFPGFSGEWEEKRLGDICKIKKGQQLSKISLNNFDKYPVINGGIRPSGYIDKYNKNENSIVISEGGASCGYVNFIKTKFWSDGHCYTLEELKNIIIVEFLYQYLKFNEKRLSNLRVGSGLPNIQQKAIISFEIMSPSLPEQQKIAAFLTAVDKKIELTDKKIKHLENYKKGLMQKLLTGKIRFPKFSGEWKLEKFDNIFLKKSYKNYQINKSKYLSNGLYPVIDQGKEKIVGYSNDFDKTINASENNIIVFGDHTREIKFIDFDCIIGADGTQLLRTKGNFDLKFFYYQLLNKKIPNMGYARHFKFLKKINFSYPLLSEQQKIASFLTLIDKKIELVTKKLENLKAYKKGLLQKMFV